MHGRCWCRRRRPRHQAQGVYATPVAIDEHAESGIVLQQCELETSLSAPGPGHDHLPLIARVFLSLSLT